MAVDHCEFGITKHGETVNKYFLHTSDIQVTILDYGAIIQSLKVKDSHGVFKDVVLGYDTLLEYEQDDLYFGCVIGRVANRIAKGTFCLHGRRYQLDVNNGPHHLHGGIRAFNKRIWTCEQHDEHSVIFNLVSADGDQGYPGNLFTKVVFIISESTLSLTYVAEVTMHDCPVNLTNHTYFNLSGHEHGSILDHRLQVLADKYTPLDDTGIPTGNIADVNGTLYDFRELVSLKERLSGLDEHRGIDDNFILKSISHPSIRLCSDESGISMDVTTTMPGVQIYTANYVGTNSEPIIGKDRVKYSPKCSICIETQFYPDSINQVQFPSCVLKVGDPYDHCTRFTFTSQR